MPETNVAPSKETPAGFACANGVSGPSEAESVTTDSLSARARRLEQAVAHPDILEGRDLGGRCESIILGYFPPIGRAAGRSFREGFQVFLGQQGEVDAAGGR